MAQYRGLACAQCVLASLFVLTLLITGACIIALVVTHFTFDDELLSQLLFIATVIMCVVDIMVFIPLTWISCDRRELQHIDYINRQSN